MESAQDKDYGIELDASRDGLEAALIELLTQPGIASNGYLVRKNLGRGQSDLVLGPDMADGCVLRMGDPADDNYAGMSVASTGVASGRLDVKTILAETMRRVTCTGAIHTAATLQMVGPDEDVLSNAFDEVAQIAREMGAPVVSAGFVPGDHYAASASVVGSIDDCREAVGKGFASDGDMVVMVGETLNNLSGSSYLRVRGGEVGETIVPDFDIERAVGNVVRTAIEAGLIRSAHSCVRGGLGVALAECSAVGHHGCVAVLDDDFDPAVALFSETPGRILVSVAPSSVDDFADLLDAANLPYVALGTVGGDGVRIDNEARHTIIDLPLSKVLEACDRD